jgi:hypothetical protein
LRNLNLDSPSDIFFIAIQVKSGRRECQEILLSNEQLVLLEIFHEACRIRDAKQEFLKELGDLTDEVKSTVEKVLAKTIEYFIFNQLIVDCA